MYAIREPYAEAARERNASSGVSPPSPERIDYVQRFRGRASSSIHELMVALLLPALRC